MITTLTRVTISELFKMITSGEIKFNHHEIGFDVLRRYDVIRNVERNIGFDPIHIDVNGYIDPMKNRNISDLFNLITESKCNSMHSEILSKCDDFVLVLSIDTY